MDKYMQWLYNYYGKDECRAYLHLTNIQANRNYLLWLFTDGIN